MTIDKAVEALKFYAELPKKDTAYEEWYDDEGKTAQDALDGLTDTVCITRAELEAMRKPNEWIPTSNREKDMANYAHNKLIDKLLER